MLRVLYNRLRSEEKSHPDPGAQTLNRLFLSEWLRAMAAVPSVTVAVLDKTAEVDIAAWLPLDSWPSGLLIRDLVIPAAFLGGRQVRGMLGYLTTQFRRGPFEVQDEVIRLFLRKGIRLTTGGSS
jgi:hypothetical protein